MKEMLLSSVMAIVLELGLAYRLFQFTVKNNPAKSADRLLRYSCGQTYGQTHTQTDRQTDRQSETHRGGL